ncbi:MAG: DUF1826 domain-containing protein, partial [Alcanivorax nanhaiticus]
LGMCLWAAHPHDRDVCVAPQHHRAARSKSCGRRVQQSDARPVRLLCTYGGPGSEWLPGNVVPAGLLTPGEAQDGRVAAEQVAQLATGQVALFKGDTWRDNPGSGVVHRSPSLSPGQQRLLVTLDI